MPRILACCALGAALIGSTSFAAAAARSADVSVQGARARTVCTPNFVLRWSSTATRFQVSVKDNGRGYRRLKPTAAHRLTFRGQRGHTYRFRIGAVGDTRVRKAAVTVHVARATATTCSHRAWRVAWGATLGGPPIPSPWVAHPTQPDAPTPAEVTYRFFVRPSISGKRIRLRFSNIAGSTSLAGSKSVTLQRVSVGLRAGSVVEGGADLDEASIHQVTFAGKSSVTIPAGGSIRSDPVALAATPATQLGVSVYIPASTYPAAHRQTYTTQYATPQSAGDHSSDASGAAFSEMQEPVFWLDGLDVLGTARRAIVAIGDSITDGEQGPAYTDDFGMDRQPTWPDALARRLAGTAAIVNEGGNGDFSSGLVKKLGHDVFDHPGVTDVVLEIGTNDIDYGMSAQEVIDNLTTAAKAAHAHGLKVTGATIVPLGDYASPVPSPNRDAYREQINTFVRTSPLFDNVLDIAKIVGQTGNDNHYRPQFDSGDHLHPNTDGYAAIAAGFPSVAAAHAVSPDRATSRRSEPKLTEPKAKLAAALHCDSTVSHATGEPVLLVHGTSGTGKEQWVDGADVVSLLGKAGHPACYVDLPAYGLSTIELSSEYVVAAVRAMRARAGRPIAMYGASQGGLLVRWALTYWPSLRGKVADAVSAAGTQHGTNWAAIKPLIDHYCTPDAGCPPAYWQQTIGSHLLAALNDGRDETPGKTAWTTIRTSTDDVVQPQTGPHPTSALQGASNILIQRVCPGRSRDHVESRVDSVAFAALLDAINHPGPARISRLPRDVCDHDYAPGVDAAALKAADAAITANTVHRSFIEYSPQAKSEPPVRAYAKRPSR